MTQVVTGAPLADSDWGVFAEALEQASLPDDDIRADGLSFFAFDDPAGRRVGYAGFERCGSDVLLRSVVTVEAVRGEGWGAAIVRWMLRRAAEEGAPEVHLLTMTAAPFFERLGFHHLDRAAAPVGIRATAQFAGLCPASAKLMVRKTGPV